MVKVDPGLRESGSSLGGSSGSTDSRGGLVDSTTALKSPSPPNTLSLSTSSSDLEVEDGYPAIASPSMRISRHSVGFSAVQDYVREGGYNEMRAYMIYVSCALAIGVGFVPITIPLYDPTPSWSATNLPYILVYTTLIAIQGAIWQLPMYNLFLQEYVRDTIMHRLVPVFQFAFMFSLTTFLTQIDNGFPIPFSPILIGGVHFCGTLVFALYLNFPSKHRKDPIFRARFFRAAIWSCLTLTFFFMLQLFILVFYSSQTSLYQYIIVCVFQVLQFTYKIAARLYNIYLGRYLGFTVEKTHDIIICHNFFIELASNIYHTIVFPRVGSYGLVIVYILLETLGLVLQLIFDTDFARTWIKRTLNNILHERYAQMVTSYVELSPTGRRTAATCFYFNVLARLLSSIVYMPFVTFLRYSYNSQFYPTIAELSKSSFDNAYIYAAASFGIAFLQGIISRNIIQHVYEIDIIKIGNNAWRRIFWQLLLIIPTAFVFPYVSLLSINNVIDRKSVV